MSVPAEQLSCQELVELVTAYLEDALSPEEQARFEVHLRLCTACRGYLDQMRRTIAALGSLPSESLPSDVRDRLLDVFHDWKRGSA